MRVTIRLMCADLDVPSGSREIEIAEGATVGQALAEYLSLYPIEDPDGLLPESMFLVSKKPAQLDSALREADELMVMRILHGG